MSNPSLEPPSEPAATGTIRRSWFGRLILCAALAAVGGSAGWGLQRLVAPAEPQPVHDSDTANDAAAAPALEPVASDAVTDDPHTAESIENETPPVGQPTPEELARSIALGEQFFIEENATAALREFEWVARFQDRSRDALLHYRIGVCAETLGDYDRALSEYGVAGTHAGDPTLRVQCQLGQARAWRSLGHPQMAVQLLSRLRLTRDEEGRAPQLDSLTSYLLAEALAVQAMAGDQSELWEDAGVVFPARPLNLFRLPFSSPAQPIATVPLRDGVRRIECDPMNPDGPCIQANLATTGLISLIDAIGEAARCRVLWSDGARQAAAGRSAALCVQSIGLSLCLDVLLAPLEIVWSRNGTEIRLHTEREIDEQDFAQRSRNAARRALEDALKEYPTHSLAPQGLLLLGNLNLRDGNLEAALGDYTRVLNEHPRSPLQIDGAFNRAKLLMMLHREHEALPSFWHVIDSGAGQIPGAAAYLYIGRLLLEAENPRRAVAPLLRAAQWGQEPEVRAHAALALAAAHLLLDNPAAANQALLDCRPDLQPEAFSDQAAFLSAFARFRAVPQAHRREPEARALLSAATHADPSTFFGRYGWYFCGQAFEELQFPERAAEVYQQGLNQEGSIPFRDAMLFGLAVAQAQLGQTEAAVQQLSELANRQDSSWAYRAGMRLCELQIRSDALADALQTGRKVLARSRTVDEKVLALQLIGSVYQRLGDHASAALCFAGSDPTSRASEPVEDQELPQ